MNPVDWTVELMLKYAEWEGDCLIWQRSCHKATGYGYIYKTINGKEMKIGAHVMMFELLNGPAKEKAVIRHSCDNPPCINPQHLLSGTHKDNARDRVNRGRGAKGIKHGRCRLTDEQVKEIKNTPKYYGSGIKLAKKFSVANTTISAVRNGQNWNVGETE